MARIQASYNNDRLCLGEQLPLDSPLSVIVDISERCNFKCNYCFRSGKIDKNWDYAAKNEIMTMEIFKKVVEQLADFPQKIKVVSLSGHGEPLCNQNIAEMVSYLKQSDTTERIEMHTNASLFTRENAIEIANSGFNRIVVSIQGLDASAYKRVCGVDVKWEHLYDMLKQIYENKKKNLKIHIKISEAALDQKNYTSDENRFYSLFGNIADSVFIEKITPLWKNIKFDVDRTKNKFGQEYGEIQYCPIVFYKIWVAPDGEIYPCTGIPTPLSLGNISKITLSDAWVSHKRQEFLRDHLQFARQNNPACIDCFVPINTITSEKDMIDPYKKDILRRLEEQF